MSRSKWLLAIVALLAMSGTVSAQVAPKWGYIEAGYIDFNPDSGSSDNGAFIGGSLPIFNNFHLLAEYDEVGDTVENVREGIVLAVALGAVYLVIVTTVLGWWKPAIREERRVEGPSPLRV